MNERAQCTEVVAAQIDRLVAGELPEPDRRSMLAWLDEEPQRWRACALAFLEAQAWEQAAGGDRGQRTGDRGQRTEDGVGGSGFRVQGCGIDARRAPTTHHSQLTTHSTPLTAAPSRWLAVAALVLVAFAIGAGSARYWPGGRPVAPQFARLEVAPEAHVNQPLIATVSVPTNLDPRLTAQLTLPLASTGDSLPAASEISDYVRQQWERRGFELSEEIRYLPARLPDGRQVMVPVTKVHVRFKGTPVS